MRPVRAGKGHQFKSWVHSFTIFADRHKSRQGCQQQIHQDLRLDGGSRLPPVAERKSAARGRKLGEEGLPWARKGRGWDPENILGLWRDWKSTTPEGAAPRRPQFPATHLSQVPRSRPLQATFPQPPHAPFRYSRGLLGARRRVRSAPWASASIVVTGVLGIVTHCLADDTRDARGAVWLAQAAWENVGGACAGTTPSGRGLIRDQWDALLGRAGSGPDIPVARLPFPAPSAPQCVEEPPGAPGITPEQLRS